MVTNKPWGSYETVYTGNDCQVKIIRIDSGQSPSYQYHYHRSETWTIISGKGIMTLDDEEHEVKTGDKIFIPSRAKHGIRNMGAEQLIFIEIQEGTYFGEDDIVRISDDYGRV